MEEMAEERKTQLSPKLEKLNYDLGVVLEKFYRVNHITNEEALVVMGLFTSKIIIDTATSAGLCEHGIDQWMLHLCKVVDHYTSKFHPCGEVVH